VALPPSVINIGNYVFKGCTSLTSVALPPSIITIGLGAFFGCESLTSVTLPPRSLISIHSTVFNNCISLTSATLKPFTIKATTAYDEKDNNWFKHFLVKAGFSRENPNDVLNGQSTYDKDSDEDSDEYFYAGFMYYDWKTWARTTGENGQLPLVTAARNSLEWYYMEQIFTANMPVINQIDALSGLPLFLLAAAGPTSDIESVYNLLKESPHSFQYISTDRTMKRKRGS